MAVYVDRLMPSIPTEKWPFRWSCHLLADTEMELWQFAKKLGLRFSWYQGHGILKHYDLTASKRREASRLGAIAIDRRRVAQMIIQERERRRGEEQTA